MERGFSIRLVALSISFSGFFYVASEEGLRRPKVKASRQMAA
jgi:hypothetical protein